jgi:hypothetical protein
MFSRDKGFVIIAADSPGDKIYGYEFRIRVVNPKTLQNKSCFFAYIDGMLLIGNAMIGS